MSREKMNADILKTKHHFEILDGLRGVAALAIVVFHFMEWVFPDSSKNFIGHGFLAVDFFFCLSGFVIGYAYDDRLEKMGLVEFFKSRLIRLHPLVILGSVLGLIALLFDPFGDHAALHSTGSIFLIFISSIFLVPYPVMQERSYNLFSLNAPAWSLFWEYVANIIYAFVLVRMGRGALLVLTVIAAMALSYIAYRTGNLLGGWSRDTFWHGGTRIFYSFCAGLLIYRSKWILQNRLGFVVLAILLLFAFLFPFVQWNWLAELLVVLVYFPLIVSLGAGAQLSSSLKGLCNFSGRISYPLYMTHYAVIWIFGNYLTTRKPPVNELALVIVTGTILMVGFAYLVMIFFDEPVRKYLTARRSKGN